MNDNKPCNCGSGLPGFWDGDYCVECSPFSLFCDGCQDLAQCEFKCCRPSAIVCEDQYEVMSCCGLPAQRRGLSVGPVCTPHQSKYPTWNLAEIGAREARELAARLPLGDRVVDL